MPVPAMLFALATITLGNVIEKSPSAVGELLLKGEDHGEIVSLRELPGPFMINGLYMLELLERPQTRELGCVRRGWDIRF